MFGDFWFDEKSDFTEMEKFHRPFHLGTFNMLTGQPSLVPGDVYQYAPNMSSNLLSILPKHVFISQEFDFFRRDTLVYIDILQKHNKVLDVLCKPGGSHLSQNSKEDQVKLFEYMHENQQVTKCSG